MLYDLDVFTPDPYQCKLGGQLFTIQRIPVGVHLQIAKKAEKFSGADAAKIMDDMIDCVLLILNLADKRITREWVEENVSANQLQPFISSIVEFMNGGESGKKKADEQQMTLT